MQRIKTKVKDILKLRERSWFFIHITFAIFSYC
jgi:hypothetical protein